MAPVERPAVSEECVRVTVTVTVTVAVAVADRHSAIVTRRLSALDSRSRIEMPQSMPVVFVVRGMASSRCLLDSGGMICSRSALYQSPPISLETRISGTGLAVVPRIPQAYSGLLWIMGLPAHNPFLANGV